MAAEKIQSSKYNITTPTCGHLLGASPPFSSSLGKAKASFLSALAHSSVLKEGEFKLPLSTKCETPLEGVA